MPKKKVSWKKGSGSDLVDQAYLERSKNILESQGNAPGFPNEWKYQEVQNHPSHTAKEYIGLDLQGSWAYIPQNKQTQPPYQAMVPDLPFAPVQQMKTANNNLLLGVSTIAAGAFLLL